MMPLQNFHHIVAGPEGAPWLIFLHGLLGTARNWAVVAPAFENDFRTLVLDQRGHGKSFKPATGYAPSDFAEDLAGIFKELGISSASIVGHSMGGRNALKFTSLYHEKVTKLVLEDIGPESTYENGIGLIEKIRGVPVPFSDKRLAKEYLLGPFNDPQLGNFLYTHIVDGGSGQWNWDFPISMVEEIISKGRAKNQWDEIKSLRCPTLVLRGEKSQELRRGEFEEMMRANSNIQGIEIPGAGHWIHFENSKRFIQVVREFLMSGP